MNFANLIHYDLMTWLICLSSSFDFAILTLTVFTLHNSIREKNYKIHSVETVSEVSQKARVKIVTYVNQKVGNG